MTTRASRALLCLACIAGVLLAPVAQAAKAERAITRGVLPVDTRKDGDAEVRLIDIYRLIGTGEAVKALAAAQQLVTDYPQFQLGQLVYGDLLTLQVRPVRMLGDLPDVDQHDATALDALRLESAMRLKALRERPPAGSIPMQFAKLAASSKHAIAVDASRSRLYLFENGPNGLNLIADYYVSVGKSGIEKSIEGDMRTPLGVYYITGSLDPRTLKAFYGAGALPINYPNPLDTRMGRTGGGIWLHGTPAEQFSRPPLATDGCVVVANPDLRRILRTVETRSTPVVIADRLQWVPPQATVAANKAFESTFDGWRSAKTNGDMLKTMAFYTQDFNSYGKSLADWAITVQQDMTRNAHKPIQTKDLSFLHWQSGNVNSMVVTFDEVPDGATTGPVRRQYWLQVQGQWKIFFEGTIG